MATYRRAASDAEKEEITGRLLAVWKANPRLRFLQLLGNVYGTGDLYRIEEDYDMIAAVEHAYRDQFTQDELDQAERDLFGYDVRARIQEQARKIGRAHV